MFDLEFYKKINAYIKYTCFRNDIKHKEIKYYTKKEKETKIADYETEMERKINLPKISETFEIYINRKILPYFNLIPKYRYTVEFAHRNFDTY